MNAIAAQLSADDIANVAAHFAAQQGATAGTAKSEFLPNVAKTGVAFPENYKTTFTKYHTINFPDTKQVRYYYANPAAIAGGESGQAAARRLVAVRRGVLGQAGRRQEAGDGAAMAFSSPTSSSATRRWSARPVGASDIPDMLRNENWNYAVFTAAKEPRPGINQAECLACHKPLDKVSYTFTLKELTAAATSSGASRGAGAPRSGDATPGESTRAADPSKSRSTRTLRRPRRLDISRDAEIRLAQRADRRAACRDRLRRRCGPPPARRRASRPRAPARRSARPAGSRRPRAWIARMIVEHLGDDERREAERRLVEQQQPRPRHQRARDRDHLLLAARERAGRRVEPRGQRREELADARRATRAARAALPGRGCPARGSRAPSSA